MTRLIIAALVLVGCGTDYASEYADWSGEYVEHNGRFTVNYNPERISGPLIDHIEQVYLEVQECVGIPTRAGLIIEYTPRDEIKDGNRGYISFRDSYIRVIERDLIDGDKTLRHEFVHFILYLADAPDYENSDHKSPFFMMCSG